MCGKGGEWRDYYELDIEFHRTMAELAGMPTIAEWITSLMHRFQLYIADGPFITEEVLKEHDAIVKSIELFDASDEYKERKSFYAIQEAVRAHMKGTAERWAVNILPWINQSWDGKKDVEAEVKVKVAARKVKPKWALVHESVLPA